MCRRLISGLSLAALALGIALEAAAPAPVRILFIGNSLTYANDLPRMVEALAKANGERIVTRTVAFPNFSLEDHWNQGEARRVAAAGGWSFVVLQQGPSALPESRVLLVDYARRFADQGRRVQARTALFMVWPASSRAGDFDGVRLSYQTAARESGGIFLPAGQAWRVAWGRDRRLPLYGPDGFHPSRLGSYLAALVIYQGLMGKSAIRSAPGVVPDADAPTLLEAAREAMQ
jgi:hypothetical protein